MAAHLRSNPVHTVVEAEAEPERVMNDFKAWASRALTRLDGGAGRKRWARHGSTRRLWNAGDVTSAVKYVAEEQGQPMSRYVSRGRAGGPLADARGSAGETT